MLVLSRKLGEVIYIGDDIKVEVISIDRCKIRLGITAPHGIPVYREELVRIGQDGRPILPSSPAVVNHPTTAPEAR